MSGEQFVVSIEDRWEPGSPYRIVIANQAQVEALEATARRCGFEAVVRRADGFQGTISWLEAQP